MVASGRNGNAMPLWDGNGIITSQSNATAGNYHSIGVAKASDVRPATATATGTWAGQTITGTDTLIIYTYGGDANLDGTLNIDDYVKIDNGISSASSGWSNGDFNYDGKVNIDDYTILDANVGIQGSPFSTASSSLAGIADGSALPLPAPSGAMVVLGGIALFRRRRRSP
jgi:hypothetical protein